MGLKARKIRTMLGEYAAECIANLNSKLGSNFSVDMQDSAIPDNVDDWNWDDEEYKLCFYNSYFMPIEQSFAAMFAEDEMYKEEINKQIKIISIVGGREMVADFDFADGTFIVKNTLCVNQKDPIGIYKDSALQDIVTTLESKLS